MFMYVENGLETTVPVSSVAVAKYHCKFRSAKIVCFYVQIIRVISQPAAIKSRRRRKQ
jgi:hypothetical protein